MHGKISRRTIRAGGALAAGSLLGALLAACQAILSLDDYRIGALDAGAGGSGGAAGGASDLGGAAGGCGGTCDPGLIAVRGTVRAYDTELPLAGVLLETAGAEVTSDENGQFSLRAQPAEWLELTLNWPEAESAGLSLPFRRTVLAFAGDEGGQRVLDVPAVRHGWLEDIARDCGALPSAATPDVVQDYFSQRNVLLVEVLGDNAAGITRDQIEVYVEREGDVYPNFASPDAGDAQPPSICFLEAVDAGGVLRGGAGTQTDATGRFAILRMRNRAGSGAGTAQVRVVNFAPAAPVTFVGAGLTGVVRVAGGW